MSLQNLKLFIITLDKDNKRTNHVDNILIPSLESSSATNIIKFSAIDGDNPDLNKIIRDFDTTIDIKFLETCSRGALACTLSHMSIWKLEIDSAESIIILEDDTIVHKDFWSSICKIQEELPDNYDFVYLYVHPSDYKSDKTPIFKDSLLTKGYKTCGTVGYMVSNSGRRKLLSLLKNMNNKIDEMILKEVSNTVNNSCKNLNTYTLITPICDTVGQVSPHDTRNPLQSNIWNSKMCTPELLYNGNEKDLTIVTSFYDIRSLDNSHGNKTTEMYLEKGKFVLNIPCNLIIFTEEKFRSTIINQRINYLDKTVIICQPLEETYFWKFKNDITNLQKSFTISNINIVKDTPLYIILTYDKFHFIEESIRLNPFNTDKFLWLDFGITHVAQNSHLIHSWIDKISDKVRLLEIAPYNTNKDPKDYFRYIYHNHAAGLISGSKSYMINFIDIFKNILCDIISNDWYQLDEAIMTMVINKYPQLCEVYYGDYQDIISNYKEYNGGQLLININIKKSVESKNYNKIYDMLQYMKSHYITKTDIDNNTVDYFYRHILTNYNTKSNTKPNKCLDVDILQYFIETNNEKIIEMLYMNITNLQLYKNTKPLLDMLLQEDTNDFIDDLDQNNNQPRLKICVAIPAIPRDVFHIKRCLDSIEAQTRKPDFVIISLTGCTEAPDHINYSFDYKIVTSENLKNAAANRNFAASLLPDDTDIICFFDCDDEMYPERLEYIEKTILKTNDDCILHNFTTIQNPKENKNRHISNLKYYKNALIINKFQNSVIVKPDIRILDRNVCHGHLSLKYAVWKNIGKYNETINTIGEDTEYCRRLISKGCKFSFIRTKLSIYHKYRYLDYLYKKTKRERFAGENHESYNTSLEGLKIATYIGDKRMIELFYYELSITSYYEKDMEMGQYSCDQVILSNTLNMDIKYSALNNTVFYLNELPIKSMKALNISLPTNFKCSTASIIPCFNFDTSQLDNTSPIDNIPKLDKTEYICLVRGVNYSIMKEGNYDIRNRNDNLITKNFMFRLDNELNITSDIKELINTSTLPKHPSLILGLEDSRLFHYNNKLCCFSTSLEYNRYNIPQICYCEINQDNNQKEITKIIPLQVSNTLIKEKNWLPFVVKDELLFIYLWDPFILCSFDPITNETKVIINKKISTFDLTGFRGSAPPIPYKDGFLCTIHYVKSGHPFKYYHRFVFLSSDYQTIKIGKGFYFEQPDIEFNLAIAHSKEGLIITSSYRDNTSQLNLVDYDVIDELLDYI